MWFQRQMIRWSFFPHILKWISEKQLFFPCANIEWRPFGTLYWQAATGAGKCVVLMIPVCSPSCVGVGACETGMFLIFPTCLSISPACSWLDAVSGALILWSACQESTEGAWLKECRGQGPEVTPGSSHFLRLSRPHVLPQRGLSLLLTQRWRYKGMHPSAPHPSSGLRQKQLEGDESVHWKKEKRN